jgi:hypothetical protein
MPAAATYGLCRVESANAVVMQIKVHPSFSRRYNRVGLRRLAIGGFTFVALNLAAIYADRLLPGLRRLPYFEDARFVMWIACMAIVVYVLGASWRGVYAAQCPDCTSKLSVKRKRPELPDGYSGLCSQCDVLWDLEMSNDAD